MAAESKVSDHPFVPFVNVEGVGRVQATFLLRNPISSSPISTETLAHLVGFEHTYCMSTFSLSLFATNLFVGEASVW